jgi:hypothetical protein
VATGESDASKAQPSVAWTDVLAITGAASALIAVLSGLAVTGALQQMQRNHGGLILLAFILVLAAASLWLVGWILRPPPPPRASPSEIVLPAGIPSPSKSGLEPSSGHGHQPVLRVVAAILFLVGTLIAIGTLIRTQHDRQRAAVSATWDANAELLKGEATVHNLGTEQRLVTMAVGLKLVRIDKHTERRYVPDLSYIAISGPDANGAVTQKLSYHFKDITRYQAVGVSASTSRSNGCDWDNEINPAKPSHRSRPRRLWRWIRASFDANSTEIQPGCVIISLRTNGLTDQP